MTATTAGPDRYHHADGSHRTTARSADGDELEVFESGIRGHVADGHTHAPMELVTSRRDRLRDGGLRALAALLA